MRSGVSLRVMLQAVAMRHPERAAITCGTETICYQALSEEIDSVAQRLHAAGVKSKNLVQLVGEDSIQFIVSLFAAQSIGAHVFLRGERTDIAQRDLTGEDSPEWESNRDLGVQKLARDCHIGAQQPLVIFATSGTTGKPRLVAHSHSTLLYGLWASYAVVAEMLNVDIGGSPRAEQLIDRLVNLATEMTQGGSTFVSCMPIASIAGYTVLQRTLYAGEHLSLLPNPEPASLHALLESADYLSTTPLYASLLLRRLSQAGSKIPNIVHAGIGGGTVVPELAAELESTLGCIVTTGYGMTETGGPVLMSRATDPVEVRHATIGRPLPGVAVQLKPLPNDFSTDNAQPKAQLLVDSPSNMLGYLDDGVLLKPDDKWIATRNLLTLSK